MRNTLPHVALASKARKGGCTRERAVAVLERLFARYGHFPSHPDKRVRRNLQHGIDAMKALAYG